MRHSNPQRETAERRGRGDDVFVPRDRRRSPSRRSPSPPRNSTDAGRRGRSTSPPPPPANPPAPTPPTWNPVLTAAPFLSFPPILPPPPGVMSLVPPPPPSGQVDVVVAALQRIENSMNDMMRRVLSTELMVRALMNGERGSFATGPEEMASAPSSRRGGAARESAKEESPDAESTPVLPTRNVRQRALDDDELVVNYDDDEDLEAEATLHPSKQALLQSTRSSGCAQCGVSSHVTDQCTYERFVVRYVSKADAL